MSAFDAPAVKLHFKYTCGKAAFSELPHFQGETPWSIFYLLFTWSSCITLLESPPNFKHAPIKLDIYELLCLAALMLCTPRSRPAVLQKCLPLPVAEPLSVLLTEFYSARLPNDVLRELAGKSFSASRHLRRALPGLLRPQAVGRQVWSDGRGLLGI